MNVSRRFVGATLGLIIGPLLGGSLAGCGGSTASYTPSNAPAGRAPDAKAAVRAWSRNMTHVGLSSAGCFEASYPSTRWSRVPCAMAAHGRTQGERTPSYIGNGRDYALKVSQPMVGAIGSFPAVSGVTRVRSCNLNKAGTRCVSYTRINVYSLQLNSNTFRTAACGTQPHCRGWSQFVYTNQPSAYHGGGNLIIQNWLLEEASSSSKLTCPSSWSSDSSSGGCLVNAPKEFRVPNVPITELGDVTLSGSASSSGDSVFFSVGSHMYGMQNAQSDSLTDLSQHWTEAEFNVVGNGGGDRAVFNTGATITVSVEANTGQNTAPACLRNAGSTGEENNLSFVAPPANPQQQQYPSILFMESNAGNGGTASCLPLAGTGT